MGLELRRIITGHNENGRAIVEIDEIASDIIARRAGIQATMVWSTPAFPADNADPRDGSKAEVATSVAGGTVFRIIRFEPGNFHRMHRTQTLDYVVCISGEIDMEMDDGLEVHMKAGDVMVQRGTMHNWVNNGTEPCVLAVILTGAQPLEVNGISLPEEG